MKALHLLPLSLAVLCAACGERAALQVADGTGPTPQLPAPNKTLVPTVNIAPATGWPSGGRPQATQGTEVKAFAEGLDHPRWLYLLPNGDVLVAESNAPASDGGFSLKGWIAGKIMKSEQNLIINLILGLVGGVIGGLIGSILGISGGWVVGLILSVVGACILIWLYRKVFKK